MSRQEPAVINRHHYREKPLPEPSIYIGRGTPLGNPKTKEELEAWLDDDLDAAERALDDPAYILTPFRAHLQALIEAGDDGVIRMFSLITPQHHLVCSCKRPDGSGVCHGDVVVELWAKWWDDGCPGLRVAIVGSKDWPSIGVDKQIIDVNMLLVRLPPKAMIITRRVEGVDRHAYRFAKHLERLVGVIDIDRERDGRGAEFKRDRALIEYAHWVYAFWKKPSTGTGHLVQLAQQLKRPLDLTTIEKDGTKTHTY